MKTKINTYLKLGILLFGISLFMTNCNNDDESVMDESQLDQTTPLVLSQKIPFKEASGADFIAFFIIVVQASKACPYS